MGVDLIGVVNHKLNKSELIKLPSIMDTWNEINLIILTELRKTYTEKYVNEKYLNIESAYYNIDMGGVKTKSNPDENYFELVWNQWVENENAELLSIQIVTYFAFIKIRRQTIIIEQMPWHKYSNLDDKDMAKMILEINRVIANKLEQNKIVYFADSSYPTSMLYNHALEGKTVEQIIQIGDTNFTNRPKEINEGIKFKYFIDEMKDDLSNLKNLDNSELYWNWNSKSRSYKRTKYAT